MALSYVNSTVAQAAVNATTIVVNVPGSVANNDLLILAVSTYSAITTPTGWTAITNGAATTNDGGVGGTFYRIASSEPASYTVTFAAYSGADWAAILAYRGSSLSTPIDVAANAWNDNAAQTCPAVTTTVAGDWIIGIIGADEASTWTSSPSGLTLRQSNTTGRLFWCGDTNATVSVGSNGPYAGVQNTSRWFGITIAISPAAAAVGTRAPLTGTRKGQKKRIPLVKAKKPLRSNIARFRLPLSPTGVRAPITGARKPQKKRIPVTKAKRAVRNSLELRIPQAPTATLPVPVRRPRGQAKRLPRVKAKRIVRNSIELRIPPAPTATLPLAVRRPRGQAKRIPRIKAKRPVRNSVQLRIPQAPLATLPLSVRRPQGQRKRLPHVKAKRPLRANLTLQRIPPAPVVTTGTLPLPIFHRGQTKRIPKVRAKRAVRNSVQLRIPAAPAAILPLPVQAKRPAKRRARLITKKGATVRRSRTIPSGVQPAKAIPSQRSRIRPAKRLALATRRPRRSPTPIFIPSAPAVGVPTILPLPILSRRPQHRRQVTLTWPGRRAAQHRRAALAIITQVGGGAVGPPDDAIRVWRSRGGF
jgi:hypothetical protein